MGEGTTEQGSSQRSGAAPGSAGLPPRDQISDLLPADLERDLRWAGASNLTTSPIGRLANPLGSPASLSLAVKVVDRLPSGFFLPTATVYSNGLSVPHGPTNAN